MAGTYGAAAKASDNEKDRIAASKTIELLDAQESIDRARLDAAVASNAISEAAHASQIKLLDVIHALRHCRDKSEGEKLVAKILVASDKADRADRDNAAHDAKYGIDRKSEHSVWRPAGWHKEVVA